MTASSDIQAYLAPKQPDGHLTHPKYRADIDGLRAIAVLSVVGFHAAPGSVRGGFVGVDIFFVISGFLISSIIFKGLDSERFSFADFYSRRVKRIFPALIVVLFVSYALGWFAILADDYKQLGKHIAGGAGFISNFLLWNESGYFDRAADTKPLLHLWSLGIEEQFYIVWPLLLYLAWKRRISLLPLVLLIGFVSFAINIIYARTDPVADFYSPLSRFWELLTGSTLAYFALRKPAFLQSQRNLRSGVGLILIAVAVFAIDKHKAFPGWWALLPTVGAFLIIASAPDAWINRKLLSNRVMVWFGLISYPLYLWHWPLLVFARIVEYEKPSPEVRIAIVLTSILLAWLTYKFVEKPIRFRGGRSWKVVVPSCLMGIMFLAGCFTYASNGLADRSLNKDERAQFLHYYDSLYRNNLRSVYRDDCDFYDGKTNRAKESISEDCTKLGPGMTYFLWGDSHAQALSYGIRNNLPDNIRLAQVTTSGCDPFLVGPDSGPTNNHCIRSNRFAMAEIARIKPDLVLLAQGSEHELTDWDALADYIHAAGGKRVALIGPVPRWWPSLPLVVAKNYFGSKYERVKIGLDPTSFDTDALLTKKYSTSSKLTYVSPISKLCTPEGCLATVPGVDEHNLMAVDYGHLSPAGSVYVANKVIRPLLFDTERSIAQ